MVVSRLFAVLPVLVGAVLAALPAAAQTVELVSRSTTAGKSANSSSTVTSVSRDGRFVVFESNATNLVAGFTYPAAWRQVYLLDRQTATITMISHSHLNATVGSVGGGLSGVISGDGNWIVFLSASADIIANYTGGSINTQAYLYNRVTGRTGLVSHALASYTQGGNGAAGPTGPNGLCQYGVGSVPSISDDGSRIAFTSCAWNLVVPGVGAGPPGAALNTEHAYLFTRTSAGDVNTAPAGTNTLVDPAFDGEGTHAGDPRSSGWASAATVSADGRYVAFLTAAIDIFADGYDALNRGNDVVLFDSATGSRTLVTRNWQNTGIAANGHSYAFGHGGIFPISQDGSTLLFSSAAPDLAQGLVLPASSIQLWLYDRPSDSLRLVTRKEGTLVEGGDRQVGLTVGGLSRDGRYAVFVSDATNLLSLAPSTRYKIFSYDTRNDTMEVVSRSSGSTAECWDPVGGGSTRPQVSPDGSRVMFMSMCQDLDATAIPGSWPSPAAYQLYLWKRGAKTARLITRNASYSPLTAYSTWGGTLPAYPFARIMSDGGDVAGFGSVSTESLMSLQDGNDANFYFSSNADAFMYADGNFVANGDFAAGLQGWQLYELPDIVASVSGGAVHFHRANPTTTPSGQAVVFQNTGVPVEPGQALAARFDIGNNDVVRKRISVLILEHDFSDLSVCTFWLAPGAPLQTYQMKTHPTKAWTNASIYFYAASTGTGDYVVDNVSLMADGSGSGVRTDCVDPTAPPAPGGADGPELLANGGFDTGTTAGWALYGQIVSQVSLGVFEFYRPVAAPNPAGVILQPTAQAAVAGDILSAQFDVGNSSPVRKRVTVLLHDLDFSDLSACTFWVEPGRALSTYSIRAFATKAWLNATLSIYAASVGDDQWTQLDNASLRRTPGASIVGTECVEPAPVGTGAITAASGGGR